MQISSGIENVLQSSVEGMQANQVKPMKPMAPIPPPGGNVENRQPPPEPSPPTGVGQHLNIVV